MFPVIRTSDKAKVNIMIKPILSAALATWLLTSGFANASTRITFSEAIAAAESQFGGEAFEAERYREDGRSFFEIEVLSGGEIYEAVFDARTGSLIEWERYNQPRRASRVADALQRARLSLTQATRRALRAKGPGARVVEAEILLSSDRQRNGRRYEVDVRTGDGVFEVVVNARNGRIVRISRD
jgi:uncharacterized membrane protein YkoI